MNKLLILAMLTISLCLHAQVGIQTSTPDLNSDLTLGSPDKGLLLNRVALKNTSNPDPLTENTPAGMLVYNTQTTPDLLPGVHVYDGEDWGEVNVKTPNYGTKLTKIKYRGRSLDPPTLKIPEMNMEFRFSPESENPNVVQLRLLSPPKEKVTYYITVLKDHGASGMVSSVITFDPETYNLWVNHYDLNSMKQFWGILISTATGVIPGNNDLNAGVFYGYTDFNTSPNYNPADDFHILAFDSY